MTKRKEWRGARPRVVACLRLGLMAFLLFPLVSSLTAQPTSSNRVLELDGKDSYVELPANLFTNEVVTVEGWVKWRKFGDYSRFFEFGDAALMVGVINFGSASELTIQRVHNRAYEGQTLEKAPADYLSADQWRHVAMVAGTVLREDEADSMRVKMRSNTLKSLGKDYLDYYRRSYRGIHSVAPLELSDDRARNVVTIVEGRGGSFSRNVQRIVSSPDFISLLVSNGVLPVSSSYSKTPRL